MTKFGPGVLTLGETASAVDASCLINGCRIAATVDAGDSTTKLCGTVRPGSRTYEWELTGNMDIDPNDTDGVFILSQTAYGTEVKFVFTPNEATGELSATGTLVIDPLDFGADEYGDDMTSDFTWAIVGVPVFTPVAAAPGVLADDGGNGPYAGSVAAEPVKTRKTAATAAA